MPTSRPCSSRPIAATLPSPKRASRPEAPRRTGRCRASQAAPIRPRRSQTSERPDVTHGRRTRAASSDRNGSRRPLRSLLERNFIAETTAMNRFPWIGDSIVGYGYGIAIRPRRPSPQMRCVRDAPVANRLGASFVRTSHRHRSRRRRIRVTRERSRGFLPHRRRRGRALASAVFPGVR